LGKEVMKFMYLNVPAKEALKQIDLLIKEGSEFRNKIYDDYNLREKDFEHLEDLKSNRLEKKRIKISKKNSITGFSEVMRSISEVARPTFSFRKEKVPRGIICDYEKQYDSWYGKALSVLEGMFQDFAPVYRFKTSLELTKFKDLFLVGDDYEKFIHVLDRFDSNLSTLVSFYNDLKVFVRSPLVYLQDKAQLWFYDFSCQLTPDSNESELCKYLFQFGVGDWKEFLDIHEAIKGDIPAKKGWDKIVLNAYDGINKKTNKHFGFNILKKQGKLMALEIPSRFVANL